MKLTGKQEWIAIAALIVYIAFTPGLQVVRDLLSGSVGKAVGLGIIMWVWKTVSKPVALLLLVNYLRCAGMREGMENPEMHCPAPFSLQPDKTCKDDKGNPGPPASVCLTGQTWDGAKCASVSSPPTTPEMPPAMPEKPAGPPPPPPAVADMPKEGFQPNQKDDKYAPA
jgi:hypothetical protein